MLMERLCLRGAEPLFFLPSHAETVPVSITLNKLSVIASESTAKFAVLKVRNKKGLVFARRALTTKQSPWLKGDYADGRHPTVQKRR